MTEQKSLPDDWQMLSLGEVSEVISGIGFPKKYQGHTEGKYPFYKVGDISKAIRNGKINLSSANNYVSQDVCKTLRGKPLQKETIVFAKIGEALKLNRRAILTQDSLVDNNVMGIVSKGEKLSNKYLYYFFLTVDLGDLSRATTVPSVRKSDVLDIQIPIPPLPEQEKIVAKIEELFTQLDAGIAELKAAQKQLKRYRQSVLKSAVEGELTREWRESHLGELEPASQLLGRILEERREKWEVEAWGKEIERAQKKAAQAKRKSAGKPVRISDLKAEEWEGLTEDVYGRYLLKNDKWKAKYSVSEPNQTENMAKLPMNWAFASLEQITHPERVICYGILMPKENIPDGVLYVKVKDMRGDVVNIDGLNRTAPAIAEKYARASLKTGDILLSIRGTYGRVAFVPEELDGGNITQDTARLDISPLLNSRYIAWHLRSNYSQNYFKRVARGVAVKGVNIGDVRPCPIMLPPAKEQHRIVEMVERRLSVADEIEKELDEALVRAERLRQSVLKSAFEGRLV